MGFIRPATPGFLVTLTATILLVVVSFCVPYFRSVYFLKATITVSGIKGSITFGTLGYCLELPNGTTCSSPSIGYQLDINGLVGNQLPVQIPQVVVKWLTYALVLHIVALGLSAGSAVFGLLAHIREMSMTCCSTCVSGFAAVVTLLAFIFDLALFFLAKARIKTVGTAEIGSAIWLTLAAWILLFFSGCFYTLGRCCISKRKPRGDWDSRKGSGPALGGEGYADHLRLDAVKAEADRKARQKVIEVGLPEFHEIQSLSQETQPLTARVEGDQVVPDEPYKDNNAYGGQSTQGSGYAGEGYFQAPAGSRAVDEYYTPTYNNPMTTYPPTSQPQQQGSGYATGGYAHTHNDAQRHPQRQPSTQSQYPVSHAQDTPNTAIPTDQYLSTAPQQHSPERHASPAYQYGHGPSGTSYHTVTSHQQYPTNYSQYGAYDSQQQRPEPTHGTDTYDSNFPNPQMSSASYQNHAPTYNSQSSPQGSIQPGRSYTLGGDGYTTNSVPPFPEHNTSYYGYTGGTRGSPPPINTNTGYVSPARASPVKGPRPYGTHTPPHDDTPPVYNIGSSDIKGAWGKH